MTASLAELEVWGLTCPCLPSNLLGNSEIHPTKRIKVKEKVVSALQVQNI